MSLYFKIATRNLRRHSRQSLAAILSVAAGFVALVLFEGYIEQSRRLIVVETRQKMMFGDINIENENARTPEGRSMPWSFAITPDEQAQLEKILDESDEIDAWAKSLRVDGLVANDTTSTIFFGVGIDTKKAQAIRGKIWFWNAIYGVPLEMSPPNSVLLGQELGRRLGCRPNPLLHVKRNMDGYENVERPFKCETLLLQFSSATPSGQISAVNLNVTGLVDAGIKDLDSRWSLMSLEMAQSLANTKSVSGYSVTMKDPSDSRKFANELQKTLTARGLPLKAVEWRDHKLIGEIYRKVMSLLLVFKNFVILIILCIAVLSVLNTLIKMVKERTRETGTWRSLGYTHRHVTLFFVIEAAMLGLAGSFVGAVTSAVLTVGANASGLFYRGGLFAESVPFSIAVVPLDYVLSTSLLVALCALGAFWATRQTLKRKISENLIHT